MTNNISRVRSERAPVAPGRPVEFERFHFFNLITGFLKVLCLGCIETLKNLLRTVINLFFFLKEMVLKKSVEYSNRLINYLSALFPKASVLGTALKWCAKHMRAHGSALINVTNKKSFLIALVVIKCVLYPINQILKPQDRSGNQLKNRVIKFLHWLDNRLPKEILLYLGTKFVLNQSRFKIVPDKKEESLSVLTMQVSAILLNQYAISSSISQARTFIADKCSGYWNSLSRL